VKIENSASEIVKKSKLPENPISLFVIDERATKAPLESAVKIFPP